MTLVKSLAGTILVMTSLLFLIFITDVDSEGPLLKRNPFSWIIFWPFIFFRNPDPWVLFGALGLNALLCFLAIFITIQSGIPNEKLCERLVGARIPVLLSASGVGAIGGLCMQRIEYALAIRTVFPGVWLASILTAIVGFVLALSPTSRQVADLALSAAAILIACFYVAYLVIG